MTQGIVLYTDGGVRPINPGFGGWGMHGYLYENSTPKKGTGLGDYVLTTEGYIYKSEVELKPKKYTEITPVHYIDGYGSFSQPITNNLAELHGVINGLKHAKDYDVTLIQIFTDSEYVTKGLNSYVKAWEKNNWRKADNTEPANVNEWKELLAAATELRSRGIVVKVDWIESHNGHVGNERSDRLATIGVMCSRAQGAKTSIEVATAEGYWKYSPNRHPFINNRRMYFNTLLEYNKPGEYYLGEHGKDDDLLGKRISDGAFSVIYLKEPDAILELLRQHQISMAGNVDNIIMARLDYLYRADTHREIANHGTLAIVRTTPHRLDLACLDKEPLTREMRPPKLAMRAVESVSSLSGRLDMYLKKDPSIITTDLTTKLYETTVKVSKKGEASSSMKLKADYNVGYAALKDVEANYQTEDGVATATIVLTLGIDLPDRNSLKRLEEYSPKVTLISWLEAPNAFRYAIVIETEHDRGIWAGVYSNLRIIGETFTS